MSDTRIIDLPTKSSMDGDEYIALDGSTNGTFKYPLASVESFITADNIERKLLSDETEELWEDILGL